MSAYTKQNLISDVENMAPKFGLPPEMEAHFATEELGLQHSGVGFERFDPGFRVPFGHRHTQQEELYVVVEGSGRLKLDDEIIDVKQWDAIRVSAETMRNFEAGPDGLAVVAFGAPAITGDKNEEAEMQPGWWSD